MCYVPFTVHLCIRIQRAEKDIYTPSMHLAAEVYSATYALVGRVDEDILLLTVYGVFMH